MSVVSFASAVCCVATAASKPLPRRLRLIDGGGQFFGLVFHGGGLGGDFRRHALHDGDAAHRILRRQRGNQKCGRRG